MPEDIILSEKQRKELDSNIREMIGNGASEQDVMRYADDYRTKYIPSLKKKEVSQPISKPLSNGVPTQKPTNTIYPSNVEVDNAIQPPKDLIGDIKRLKLETMRTPKKVGQTAYGAMGVGGVTEGYDDPNDVAEIAKAKTDYDFAIDELSKQTGTKRQEIERVIGDFGNIKTPKEVSDLVGVLQKNPPLYERQAALEQVNSEFLPIVKSQSVSPQDFSNAVSKMRVLRGYELDPTTGQWKTSKGRSYEEIRSAHRQLSKMVDDYDMPIETKKKIKEALKREGLIGYSTDTQGIKEALSKDPRNKDLDVYQLIGQQIEDDFDPQVGATYEGARANVEKEKQSTYTPDDMLFPMDMVGTEIEGTKGGKERLIGKQQQGMKLARLGVEANMKNAEEAMSAIAAKYDTAPTEVEYNEYKPKFDRITQLNSELSEYNTLFENASKSIKHNPTINRIDGENAMIFNRLETLQKLDPLLQQSKKEEINELISRYNSNLEDLKAVLDKKNVPQDIYEDYKARAAELKTLLSETQNISNRIIKSKFSDEDLRAYQAAQKQYTEASDYAKQFTDVNGKYGEVAKHEASNVAQELFGQKLNFAENQVAKFFGGTVMPIAHSLEDLTNAWDRNSADAAADVIGRDIVKKDREYLTQENSLYNSFKIVTTPELQKKIDAINALPNLTDKDRIAAGENLLQNNSGWYIKPIEPELNHSLSSYMYSLADTANVIAQFVLKQAALGGVGSNVSRLREMLTATGIATMDAYNEKHASNLENNVPNPKGNALLSSAITGASIGLPIGLGGIGKIKKIFSGDSVLGKVMSETTDDELLALLKPTNLATRVKDIGTTYAKGFKHALPLTTSMGIGGAVNEYIENGKVDTGQMLEHLLIEQLKFPLIGTAMQLGGRGQRNQIREKAIQYAAVYPERALSGINNALKTKAITIEDAEVMRKDILKVRKLWEQKVVKVDKKGNPLSDEVKSAIFQNVYRINEIDTQLQEALPNNIKEKLEREKHLLDLETQSYVSGEKYNEYNDSPANIKDLLAEQKKLQLAEIDNEIEKLSSKEGVKVNDDPKIKELLDQKQAINDFFENYIKEKNNYGQNTTVPKEEQKEEVTNEPIEKTDGGMPKGNEPITAEEGSDTATEVTKTVPTTTKGESEKISEARELSPIDTSGKATPEPKVESTTPIEVKKEGISFDRKQQHEAFSGISDAENNDPKKTVGEYISKLFDVKNSRTKYGGSEYYNTDRTINGKDVVIRVSDHPHNESNTKGDNTYTISIIVNGGVEGVSVGNNYAEIGIKANAKNIEDKISDLYDHFDIIEQEAVKLNKPKEETKGNNAEQTINTESDASKISSPEKMDVDKQTTNGEGVGEGNPKGQTTTKQSRGEQDTETQKEKVGGNEPPTEDGDKTFTNSDGKKVVSIANEPMRKFREENGLQPLENIASIGNEEVFNKVVKKMNEDPLYEDEVITQAMNGTLPLSEAREAQVALNIGLAKKQYEVAQATKALQKARDTNDTAMEVKSMLDIDRLMANIEMNHKASKLVGWHLGGGLQIRQILLSESYAPEFVKERLKSSFKGSEVPKHVQETMDRLVADNQRLMNELAEAVKNNGKQKVQEKINATVKRLKGNAKKTELSEVDELEAAHLKIQELEKALKDADERASKTASDKSIRQQQKEARKAKTAEAIKESKTKYDEAKKNFLNKIKEQRNKLSSNPIPVELIPELAVMAKELIYQGAVKASDIVNNIYEEFKHAIPELTERHIRDAISGYGKVKIPKEIAEEEELFRIAKQTMRYLSKIESAKEGEAPLRATKASAEPTENVQAALDEQILLRKELNELLKKHDLNVDNPQDVLKTVLDKIKKGLENRIKILTDAIETDTPLPKKEAIEYTDEIKELKKKAAELGKLYQEKFNPKEAPKTAEQLKINRLEKQVADNELELSNLKKGIVKNKEQKPEITNDEIKRLEVENEDLKEQIFNAKKELGLNPSKMVLKEKDFLTNDGIFDKIKEAYKNKSKDEPRAISNEMASDMQKVMDNLISSGITDAETIVNHIHKELKTDLSVSREDVEEALTRRTQKTRDEDVIVRRNVRTAIDLLAKIAKLEKGIETEKNVGDKQVKDTLLESYRKRIDNILRTQKLEKYSDAYKIGASVQRKTLLLDELKKQEEQLAKDIRENKYVPVEKVTEQTPQSQETLHLANEIHKTRNKIEKMINDWEYKNRPRGTKLWEGFAETVKVAPVFGVMTVYGKLSMAAAWNLITRPIEWGMKSTVRGGLNLAAKAGNLKAEVILDKTRRESEVTYGSIKTGWNAIFTKKIMGELWGILKDGYNDYTLKNFVTENPKYTRTWLAKYVYNTHSMIKYFPKKVEFETSFKKRTDMAIKNGEDITSLLVLERIKVQATEDALRSIFMNRNFITKGISRMKTGMASNPSMNYKRYGMEDNYEAVSSNKTHAINFVLDFLFPVTKVATNYALENASYIPLAGGARAYHRLLFKTMEKISEEDADLVVKLLSRQLTATASYFIGMMAYSHFGGQEDKTKLFPKKVKAGEEKELKHNDMEVKGLHIPHHLLHSPFWSSFQSGATTAEQFEKDGISTKDYGKMFAAMFYPKNILRDAVNVSMEVPYIGGSRNILKSMGERGDKSLSQWAAGFVVDRLTFTCIKEWAKVQQGENRPKFSPQSISDEFKKNAPFLWKDVPIKEIKPPTSSGKKQQTF